MTFSPEMRIIAKVVWSARDKNLHVCLTCYFASAKARRFPFKIIALDLFDLDVVDVDDVTHNNRAFFIEK